LLFDASRLCLPAGIMFPGRYARPYPAIVRLGLKSLVNRMSPAMHLRA
jgi:hypothetical protein